MVAELVFIFFLLVLIDGVNLTHILAKTSIPAYVLRFVLLLLGLLLVLKFLEQ